MLGRAHILADGAHRLAELGLLDKEGEHRHRKDRDDDREHGGEAEGRAAEGDARAAGDRGHGAGHVLRARAENELEAVFEQEGDADGGDEQRETGRGAQRRVGHLLNDDAEQGARQDRDEDGDDRVQVEVHHAHPRGVGAHHDDVAVREV